MGQCCWDQAPHNESRSLNLPLSKHLLTTAIVKCSFNKRCGSCWVFKPGFRRDLCQLQRVGTNIILNDCGVQVVTQSCDWIQRALTREMNQKLLKLPENPRIHCSWQIQLPLRQNSKPRSETLSKWLQNISLDVTTLCTSKTFMTAAIHIKIETHLSKGVTRLLSYRQYCHSGWKDFCENLTPVLEVWLSVSCPSSQNFSALNLIRDFSKMTSKTIAVMLS